MPADRPDADRPDSGRPATDRPCPTCGTAVAATVPTRPFCTARCKWVDLGKWFDGSYRVPAEDPDALDAIVAYELDAKDEDDA